MITRWIRKIKPKYSGTHTFLLDYLLLLYLALVLLDKKTKNKKTIH